MNVNNWYNEFYVINLVINHLYALSLGIHKGEHILQTPLDMLERQHLLPRMECDLMQRTLPLLSQMVRF